MEGVPILEGRYSNILDMYPLECKEFNRLHTFYDHLREGRWTTTRCKDCAKVSYPPRVICPDCYSEELEWIDLPSRGKVATAAEKVGGIPIGFHPPLITAWIEFPEGSPIEHVLSLVIHCDQGTLKEGDEVELVVFNVPSHPIDKRKEKIMVDRVFFAFQPVKQ